MSPPEHQCCAHTNIRCPNLYVGPRSQVSPSVGSCFPIPSYSILSPALSSLHTFPPISSQLMQNDPRTKPPPIPPSSPPPLRILCLCLYESTTSQSAFSSLSSSSTTTQPNPSHPQSPNQPNLLQSPSPTKTQTPLPSAEAKQKKEREREREGESWGTHLS